MTQEAVGKLRSDVAEAGDALYSTAYQVMTTKALDQVEHGSPPDEVAAVISEIFALPAPGSLRRPRLEEA